MLAQRLSDWQRDEIEEERERDETRGKKCLLSSHTSHVSIFGITSRTEPFAINHWRNSVLARGNPNWKSVQDWTMMMMMLLFSFALMELNAAQSLLLGIQLVGFFPSLSLVLWLMKSLPSGLQGIHLQRTQIARQKEYKTWMPERQRNT